MHSGLSEMINMTNLIWRCNIMHIAICDSDDCFCSLLERLVEEYSELKIVDINVDIFNASERLIEAMTDAIWFDLIFLSVEQPGTNGFDVGKSIRDILKNDMSSIVYLSCNKIISRSLFDSRPLNFHFKPISKHEIFKDIDTVMRLSNQFNSTFVFKSYGTVKGVEYSDILYFSMEQKLVRIHTNRKKYMFRGNLNDVINSLPTKIFRRCHKSYIINLNYNFEIKSNCFELNNGEVIPIGRKYREYVNEVCIRHSI